MKAVAATKAKNSFGEMLDSSQRGPVRIEKNGRGVAVLISMEEYERLTELEEQWWADRARKAAKQGYVGRKASEDLFRKLLE